MIGIGVIGYGYWGPNLARNFAETPGAQLRAICDLRPDRLGLARARHPVVLATADPAVVARLEAAPTVLEDWPPVDGDLRLWSDDYSSLFRLMK